MTYKYKATVISYLLYILSFILMFDGVVLIQLGSDGSDWIGGEDVQKLLLNASQYTKGVFLGLGLFVYFTAVYCCVANFVRGKFSLLVMIIEMVCLVVMEIGLIFYFFLSAFDEKNLRNNILRDKDARKELEPFEIKYHCCGFIGYGDYNKMYFSSPCIYTEYKNNGCIAKLKIALFAGNFLATFVMIGVVEILEIICLILLRRFLGKKDDVEDTPG